MFKAQQNTDKLAMGISMACIIHCFFAPSLIIMSYGFLSFSVDSELIHLAILLTAFPISMLALSMGFKNHKVMSYLLMGICGLAILTIAFLLEESIGQPFERFLTVAGASVIAFSHFKNYQKCNEIKCSCHE